MPEVPVCMAVSLYFSYGTQTEGGCSRLSSGRHAYHNVPQGDRLGHRTVQGALHGHQQGVGREPSLTPPSAAWGAVPSSRNFILRPL